MSFYSEPCCELSRVAVPEEILLDDDISIEQQSNSEEQYQTGEGSDSQLSEDFLQQSISDLQHQPVSEVILYKSQAASVYQVQPPNDVSSIVLASSVDNDQLLTSIQAITSTAEDNSYMYLDPHQDIAYVQTYESYK